MINNYFLTALIAVRKLRLIYDSIEQQDYFPFDYILGKKIPEAKTN